MRLKPRRAGRSSTEIWRANRRRAFREAWRLNLLSVALLLGCFIGIAYTEGFGELVFAAVIGAMLSAHAFVWTLGGHVGAVRWMKGVWGEQATEEELEKLGTGWLVEHDIPRSRGNWDHVAVSRAGVFMIETKWTTDSASVNGDVLKIGRRVSYPCADFRAAAADLRDTLALRVDHAPWVTAVVAIWGQFEQTTVEGDRVAFVKGSLLADWLAGQPTRLRQDRTRELAEAVSSLANQARS